MDNFQKWQIGLLITQNVILVLTLIGAIYIGIKQNNINESLLDLNFSPSIDLNYNQTEKSLYIYNKGSANLYLFGTKLGDGEKSIDAQGRQITPGGSYYLLADNLESGAIKVIGQNGEQNVPFEIYLESGNGKKYKIVNNLFIKITSGVIKIHTQTISTNKVSNW